MVVLEGPSQDQGLVVLSTVQTHTETVSTPPLHNLSFFWGVSRRWVHSRRGYKHSGPLTCGLGAQHLKKKKQQALCILRRWIGARPNLNAVNPTYTGAFTPKHFVLQQALNATLEGKGRSRQPKGAHYVAQP